MRKPRIFPSSCTRAFQTRYDCATIQVFDLSLLQSNDVPFVRVSRKRTLQHEQRVLKNNVRMMLNYQDLGSLGVPFLSVDEDGRSVLNKPQLMETKEDDKPVGIDQPPKPNEDFPDSTTYFYHRWMWIQVGRLATPKYASEYSGGGRSSDAFRTRGSHTTLGFKHAGQRI